MAKGYVRNETCSFKVGIYLNRDGNILQPGETVGGSKKISFGGFASSIPASEAVNDENSSAIHNGVAGLIWLLSGTDENFKSVQETLNREHEEYRLKVIDIAK